MASRLLTASLKNHKLKPWAQRNTPYVTNSMGPIVTCTRLDHGVIWSQVFFIAGSHHVCRCNRLGQNFGVCMPGPRGCDGEAPKTQQHEGPPGNQHEKLGSVSFNWGGFLIQDPHQHKPFFPPSAQPLGAWPVALNCTNHYAMHLSIRSACYDWSQSLGRAYP